MTRSPQASGAVLPRLGKTRLVGAGHLSRLQVWRDRKKLRAPQPALELVVIAGGLAPFRRRPGWPRLCFLAASGPYPLRQLLLRQLQAQGVLVKRHNLNHVLKAPEHLQGAQEGVQGRAGIAVFHAPNRTHRCVHPLGQLLLRHAAGH